MRTSYISILILFIRILWLHSSFRSKWKFCNYVTNFSFWLRIYHLLLILSYILLLIFTNQLLMINDRISNINLVLDSFSLRLCSLMWNLLLKFILLLFSHSYKFLIFYLEFRLILFIQKIIHLLDSLQSLRVY